MYEILMESPLFRGLRAGQIEELLSRITFRIRKYEGGEVIAYSGDVMGSQPVIIKGSVKGEMIDFAGRVIKIEDIESPRPLAPAILFGKNNKYPVNIIANN